MYRLQFQGRRAGEDEHGGFQGLAPTSEAANRAGQPAGNVKLYMTYFAYGGLCNQVYCHINALALGRHFNFTLITFVAWSRKTFNTTEQTEFIQEDIETLLDVGKMAEYWKERGIVFSTVGRPGWPAPAGCTAHWRGPFQACRTRTLPTARFHSSMPTGRKGNHFSTCLSLKLWKLWGRGYAVTWSL